MTIAKLETDGEKLDRGDAHSLGGLTQLIRCSQPQPGIDMQFSNNAGKNVPMIGWLGAHLVGHTPGASCLSAQTCIVTESSR